MGRAPESRSQSITGAVWCVLFLFTLPVLLFYAHQHPASVISPAEILIGNDDYSKTKAQLELLATDFGVVGDGIQDDTRAMRRLLNLQCHCHKHIVIPEHAIVKTFPLNLTSDTTLQVDGALIAIQSSEHWTIMPPVPSLGTSEDRSGNGGWLINQYQSFLYASHATNIRITGKGTIDGGGPYWWNLFKNKTLYDAGRPNLVQVFNCSDVEMDTVTMKDSPFWTVHPISSRDLHIHHLKIRAPLYSPNVDGIDPDSSQNVLIEYNDVSCGDDHIAIKAGVCGMPGSNYHYVNDCRDPIWSTGRYATRNVTVRHNLFRTGMGIAIGSESSGGVHDVHIYNNTVGLCRMGHDTADSCGWGSALHLKTTVERSGVIENVVFEDNIVYNTTTFILLETDYQVQKQDLPPDYPKTIVRNIVFRNNQALGEARGADFQCTKIDPCHSIQLLNNTILKAGNDDDEHSPWQCHFIDSYNVSSNYPSGLDKCMAQSMNGTSALLFATS